MQHKLLVFLFAYCTFLSVETPVVTTDEPTAPTMTETKGKYRTKEVMGSAI